MTAKRYDQSYFDRWYRDPRRRVHTPAAVKRKVRLVVAITEFVLERPLRSVLDVGCGEAPWQPLLQRLRPGSRYAGVDPSPYAVRRFGRRRNVRQGRFGALDQLGLEEPFDLVVCADMLHYLATAELRRGLAVLAPLVSGVAFLEALTSADLVEGDTRNFQWRSPAVYRRLFGAVGLEHAGWQCYLPRALAQPSALERMSSAVRV